MSIASDLEKLVELRRLGALTPTEFDKAKARLLDENPAVLPKQVDPAKYLAAFSNLEKRTDTDELANAVYTKFRNYELFKAVGGFILAIIILSVFLPSMLHR